MSGLYNNLEIALRHAIEERFARGAARKLHYKLVATNPLEAGISGGINDRLLVSVRPAD